MTALEHRVPPPVVFTLCAVAMWGVSLIGPVLAVAPVVRYGLASGLVGLGLFISLSGVRAFRRAQTTLDPVKIERATQLVSGSILQRTRNPMYLGLAIMLVAWSVGLAAPAALPRPAGVRAVHHAPSDHSRGARDAVEVRLRVRSVPAPRAAVDLKLAAQQHSKPPRQTSTSTTKKPEQPCKPGSVPRLREAMHIRLGRTLPCASSEQPGSRRASVSSPIGSCSRWGLPCHLGHPKRGALLPHRFTLTRL